MGNQSFLIRLSLIVKAGCLILILSTIPSFNTFAELPDDKLAAENYPVRHGELTPREMAVAVNAWQYFVHNLQPTTGLVNAVNNYPSTTMWDSASYLAALVSARELGIINKEEFDHRMLPFLKTLNNLSLFQGQLPNKAYNTITAEKVDYLNKPGEIGFSAIDTGRMLIWLKIIKERYPEYANSIDNVVLGWDFSHVVDDCGTLYGAILDKNNMPQYVQEGRLGYEEYAASGFQLWGFSTCQASRPEPYDLAKIYCVLVPYDSRDPRTNNQHNYVVTESYILHGFEMGWDRSDDRANKAGSYSHPWMKNFANRVYQAQENRYRETGILTARSEHQLDKAPFFVYDTVFADGYNWNTITDQGVFVPENAAVSLKAALGMWVLWHSPYTDRLFDAIENANVKGFGFNEGLYENGHGPINEFTANNNGIMLEALFFKKAGKILRFTSGDPSHSDYIPSLWERKLINGFDTNNSKRNRPYIDATPSLKAFCDQTGIAIRKAPNCKSCQCAQCPDESSSNNNLFKLPAATSCAKQ